MRSIKLIFLGTLLATTLGLPSAAHAQKAAEKKKTETKDPSGKEQEKADAKADADGDGKEEGGLSAASKVEPPAEKWDITDVEEVPGRSYFFVGLRYRGNVIPSFMLNMFVEEGKTIYTNMIGVEFDLRKDGFSLIPALSYHELGTGDILFKQKNTLDIPGNYSVVNSGLKLLYAQVDLLWSAKISKNVEFEYGAGFGLGAVFGTLQNNWVTKDGKGALTSAKGDRYSRCPARAAGTAGPEGCNRAEHQNSDVDKIGTYDEPSWFNGGSKPAIFPWISPQIGLRIKPIKQFVSRIGVGFSLTGFWFGLSGQYGLEKKRD